MAGAAEASLINELTSGLAAGEATTGLTGGDFVDLELEVALLELLVDTGMLTSLIASQAETS